MEEEIVYSDNNVSITTSRIAIFGTTYALRNITSVKMTMTPAKQGCAIVLLIFGAFSLLGAFGAFGSDVTSGVIALLFSAAVIAVAVMWLRKCKPDYNVSIASASGEAHALTSKDRNYVEQIVGHINEVIARY